jgi:transposase
MKACLIRFGVRAFKPTLRKAPDRLVKLRTPEGVPLPPNTIAEMRRDMARLLFVRDQIKEIEQARLQRLAQAPKQGAHAMVHLLARVVGVGIETADMLAHEVLSRNMRDRRAVARYAGITGSPDESGSRRRQKGLARAGNARVRRGMIQLAWRFLKFQKDSALAQWYRGLLRLYACYGPSDRAATQGDLCHEAPALPVAQPGCSSASGLIDNYPGGTLLN